MSTAIRMSAFLVVGVAFLLLFLASWMREAVTDFVRPAPTQ